MANKTSKTSAKAANNDNGGRDIITKSLEGRKGRSLPSRLIDARIAELGDWRGEMLARVRKLIKQANHDVIEEWKWRGVPVWEHDGIICTGETYKAGVKLTFARGAPRWRTL